MFDGYNGGSDGDVVSPTMQNRYFSYLDQRATQRRLAAKFIRPRKLAIHTALFVIVMTAIVAYGTGAGLWFYRVNFELPTVIGLVWSIALALHAMRHYRRSAARTEQREIAVEEEMRHFIDSNGGSIDDETLFAMHRGLENELETRGHWSTALTAFAAINVLSWLGTAMNIGTSWGFQLTLPSAILIIGGVKVFLHWRQQRRMGQKTWLSRLPLAHIVVYVFGAFALGMAGMLRAVNAWDAENAILVWGAVLLVHIALMVVIMPILQNVMSSVSPAEKRKGMPQLALAADGELVERFREGDAEVYEVEPKRKLR